MGLHIGVDMLPADPEWNLAYTLSLHYFVKNNIIHAVETFHGGKNFVGKSNGVKDWGSYGW